MKRGIHLLAVVLVVGACGKSGEQKASPAETPETKTEPAEKVAAVDAPKPDKVSRAPNVDDNGRSGIDGSCLGRGAVQCQPGLTCMGRGSGGTCKKPSTGGKCGTAKCTDDEFCCSEKHNRCQLAGTDCHAELPTEAGAPGARCGGAAGVTCMPGMQCVTLLDRVGGKVASSEGHCQLRGREGATCTPETQSSCRGGFVCTKAGDGARCRMPPE